MLCLALSLVVATLSPGSAVHDEPELPVGFQIMELVPDWDQPVGLTFAPNGIMYVWEKAGRVWVVEYGHRHPVPFLDISEEVGNFSSHGLKSVALDPDFLVNGHCYLLYDVDRHHLFHHGTPGYDPEADDHSTPTIARLTRFTADPEDGFRTADPATRQVLIGATHDTGIPQLHIHECGTAMFGRDGSLLVSAGDGGWVAPADFGGDERTAQARAEGILQPDEDIGTYRSQMLDSHCGKILRIDPATGEGLPDNPFYDAMAPSSPRSRVWALGLRNPYRMTIVPDQRTRHSDDRGGRLFDPNDMLDPANPPGVIAVGDVGNHDWEELDLVTGPGQNFGWPIYESMDFEPELSAVPVPNPAAPNPLYDGVSCTQQFLSYQDLLIQETAAVPYWGNPCDQGVPIPPTLLPQMHVRPVLTWYHHGDEARAKGFDAAGNAIHHPIDDPASLVKGEPFEGDCSIGGTWLRGDAYPPEYRHRLYHADYETGWIRSVTIDSEDRARRVEEFASGLGPIVCMAEDPVYGQLYYIRLDDHAKVCRIDYYPGNIPPSAVGHADPSWGPEPLRVHFDASHSRDPEEGPLRYAWDLRQDPGHPRRSAEHFEAVFPSVDITDEGTLIALVLELDPPQDIDFPGFDHSVVHDGEFAPAEGFALEQTYYSYYEPIAAKGGLDWLGYEFPAPRTMHGLIYQAAAHQPSQGGWFESDVRVELRQQGQWVDAGPLTWDPPYAGVQTPDVQIHHLLFDEIEGDAIRLIGTAGGDWDYVGYSELRVLAAPESPLPPTRYNVQLEVEDAANASDSEIVPVWVNNSPPAVSIDSLPRVGTYDAEASILLPLESSKSDAEHAESELECEWHVVLYHNEHRHPEPLLYDCDTAISLLPHSEGEGEVVYYEIALIVSDPLELSTTVRHYLVPDHDCNLNGYDDADDISSGRSEDLNGDGVPDECEQDCNGNLIPDPVDIVVGLSRDDNENGIPDECE